MTNILTNLKPLNIAGLTKINPKKKHAAIDATKGLTTDEILRSKFEKHSAEIMVRNRKAKQLLQRLPEAGEVFTVLMSGSFDGWDYVQAVLDLASPATIAELYVATLGFSDDNAGHLLNSLENGSIGKVWFVASCYMRDQHGDKFSKLHQMLEQRGHHCRATRNHAKILAMKLTTGTTIVVTGSINLCACRNLEIAHIWNDHNLFDFSAAFIKEQAEDKTHVK